MPLDAMSLDQLRTFIAAAEMPSPIRPRSSCACRQSGSTTLRMLRWTARWPLLFEQQPQLPAHHGWSALELQPSEYTEPDTSLLSELNAPEGLFSW